MRKQNVSARIVFAGLAFLLCGCSGASRAAPGADTDTIARHDSVAELVAASTRVADSHQSVSMDLDLGREGSGSCVYHAESPSVYAYRCEFDSTENGKPGRTVLVLTPSVTYVEIPVGQRHSDRKSWLTIRAGEDPALFQHEFGTEQIRDLAVPDKMIPTSGATIVHVAPDNMDGKSATRYTIDIDTAAAARNAMTGEQRSQMKYLADQGISTVEVNYWVDAQDLPVKIEAVTSIPKIGPLGSTVRYRDWGSPVRIDVPSDDQVSTVLELGGR
ncbi:hypothetical protein ACQPW1_14500 [Nocardia sp. CA-128927]|uniref:hypothetical protein n=1 Tax=Nocardia sp. CA-128927 TaxID=3239975 RepID=UPI003D951FD8